MTPILITSITCLIDMIIKWFLPYNCNWTIINKPMFTLSIVKQYNKGFAFGLRNSDEAWVNNMINVLALIIMSIYIGYSEWNVYLISLMIAGSSNFLDRLLTGGTVTDWISVRFGKYRFPIFNIADAMINLNFVAYYILT